MKREIFYMKQFMTILALASCLSAVYANEPGWTEKERESKRDILIEGEVQNVKKLHELKNYRWTEIWSADIKVSAVHKGSEELKEQTISVLFERGTIIEGTKIRNKRCPRYAELCKGDKGKLYIVRCTKGHLKRLEMNEETKDALLIGMGSDVAKTIPKKEKKDNN
jgi:hypothetical protein